MIILFVGIFFIAFFGHAITSILAPDQTPLFKWSAGFLVGLGLLTWLLFLLYIIGIPFSSGSISIVLLGCLVFSLSLKKLLFKKSITDFDLSAIMPKKRLDIWELGLLGIISVLIANILVNSLYWPVVDWDSLALYDFRAQSFFFTGGMTDAISRGYFFGYPLLTSLGHSIIYFFGYPNPGIIHGLFYVSLLGIFYSFLASRTSRKLALIATLLVAINRPIYNHAYMTYTNLGYLSYITGSVILFLEWHKRKTLPHALLFGIMLGLSTWVRTTEPFWVPLVFLTGIFCVYWKSWLQFLLVLVPTITIRYSWLFFEQYHLQKSRTIVGKVGGYFEAVIGQTSLSQISAVMAYLYRYLFVKQWLLFGLFAILLLFSIKYRNKISGVTKLMFGLLLFNLGLIVAGTYVFSLTFATFDGIGESLTRMSLFLVPLFITLAALVIHDLYLANEKK